MTVFALIVFIVALVVFLLSAFNLPSKINLAALGLAILTAAVIIQYTVHGAHVH